MSDNTNTILGGPPSGTDSPPGAGGASGRTRADAPEGGVDVPGDATTAYHRSRLYSLLALGFDRPGEDFEAALADGAFTEDVLESARAIDEDVAIAAGTVGDAVTDLEALYSRWASLFGVEEGVTVPPYELRYLPGPLMTNVRKLADVRGFYEAFGLEVAEGKNDRGDHVCFMTEFMGYLCLKEGYLRNEGDARGVGVVVDAQKRFLEDHLGRWYWRFADEVSAHDRGFYAALGDLLSAFVEHEVDRLDLDPEWVPDNPEVTDWDEGLFGDSGRSCGGCGLDSEGVDWDDLEDPT